MTANCIRSSNPPRVSTSAATLLPRQRHDGSGAPGHKLVHESLRLAAPAAISFALEACRSDNRHGFSPP